MARPKNPPLSTPWTAFYHPVKEERPYGGRIQVFSYGPKEARGREELPPSISGPFAFARSHPELFKTSSTSLDEGVFYYGCLTELGPHGDEGGWVYQRAVSPGGNKIGGAIVDFVFFKDPRDLAVRIKTPFYHRPDPDIVEHDDTQLTILEDYGYTVIDAPSELYMDEDDEDGIAVRDMVRRVYDEDPLLMPGSMIFYSSGS
jgi:hypothetical protein